jgi:hypothetical protein
MPHSAQDIMAIMIQEIQAYRGPAAERAQAGALGAAYALWRVGLLSEEEYMQWSDVARKSKLKRPDHVKCIASSRNFEMRSLCGRGLSPVEWAFLSIEHAQDHEAGGGRLVLCEGCRVAADEIEASARRHAGNASTKTAPEDAGAGCPMEGGRDLLGD